MRLQYVAVEGVIGVGKTSLVHKLANHFDAQELLEQYDENPFLKDFYNNPRQFAFPTQLFFLLSRYRQQQQIPQRELFHDLLISDYVFAKDRIFASINLEDRELFLYEKVASMLEQDITSPDLVIYLQSNTERIRQNIKERNRDFERNISVEYIQVLNEAYNRFFFNYARPLLIVNSTEIDFVNVEEDFEDLIGQILKPISGSRYYSPMK